MHTHTHTHTCREPQLSVKSVGPGDQAVTLGLGLTRKFPLAFVQLVG